MEKIKRLEIRLTDTEKEYISEMAEQCGMTMTEYIMSCIRDGEVIVKDTTAIQQLAMELNKIGVNINQIARRVNEQDGMISKSDVEMLKEEFDKLSAEVYGKLWSL